MNAFKRLLRNFLLASCSIYAVILILLIIFENSLVYPGSKYPRGNWDADSLGFSEVRFKASDGTELVGWYLPYSRLKNEKQTQKKSGAATDAGNDTVGRREDSGDRPRTILHCHGNGENIAQVGNSVAKQFQKTLRGNIFLFDYRGYGKSEGSATELGVQMDADAALDWVCKKDSVQAKDVIIIGHSIGGGPACYLAKKHGCKALVLQRTFSSLPDAAGTHYPFFPVRWIMQNQMNSVEAIKTCHIPLFQSHGDKDRVVPIQLGKKVFQNSPAQKKKFFEVPGMTHYDFLPPQYWQTLQQFVDEVDPVSVPPTGIDP